MTRIGAALNEAGIPFDVNADGSAVLVRYGQTATARMLLAEKGLPQSANAGYELFDRMGSFGLTSFMQEVTRVRVLEGEIARTIQSLNGVKAARVHIVVPEEGSFRRAQHPPSASVVIRTDSPDERERRAVDPPSRRRGRAGDDPERGDRSEHRRRAARLRRRQRDRRARAADDAREDRSATISRTRCAKA